MAEPDTKIMESAPDALDGAFGVVHAAVKEVDWIRHLSTRLCRERGRSDRTQRDLECIQDLSASVSDQLHRFLSTSCPSEAVCGELEELAPLIDQAILQVARRGAEIRILRHVEEDVRHLKVPVDLRLALVAVLENAVDFGRGDDPVRIIAAAEGAGVAITVVDSGAGMSLEVLSACRVRGFTTRQETGGHGVGLSCASEVLARDGGELRLASTPGVGTQAVLAFHARA